MSNFIRNTIAFMFSLLGVVYSANALESGGIDINYDVVRAAGMGNTGAGISMGAGSVFLNPGALSLQYDNEILITGTGWVSYTAYRDRTPSLYSTVSKPQWNTPFGMYAVFRPNRQNRFAFGLSINSPFSIKTAWKNDWKGRAIVNNYVFNTVIIQPTLSIRVSEKVGIGLGVMYCRGGLWADKIIR